MQAGLPSRVAAIKALEYFPSWFETLSDMRQWLFSDKVQAATNLPDWPIRETAIIWKDFVNQHRMAPENPHGLHQKLLRATFVDGTAPRNLGLLC